MTSTEIALLLNSDLEKVVRIGEIIGKKIPERDEFSGLNDYEKTFIYIDVLIKKIAKERRQERNTNLIMISIGLIIISLVSFAFLQF